MIPTASVPSGVRPASVRQTAPRRIALPAGLALYSISFLLPAVGMGSGSAEGLPGWMCAQSALVTPFSQYHVDYSWILFGCGLINPLLLVCLALRMRNAQARSRRGLAILTLSLLPLNWIYMGLNPGMTPQIGHFVWIAGLLLLLVPEALFGRRSG